ncbi:MAG: DoxX family protein [Actinomycetes bacterium]
MALQIHLPSRRRSPAPERSWPTRLAGFLSQHSIDWLRVSLGLVIVGFGLLKFFPGESPAEPLVVPTTEMLTVGVVSGQAAMVATALLECFIGFTLLTGVALRLGLVAMAGWLLGILSPVVLMAGTLFPDGLPTIEAQYVLEDVILATAAAVVAARALGARLVAPTE